MNIVGIALISLLVQFVNPIAFATVDISLLGAALFLWWQAKTIQRKNILGLLVIAVSQMPFLAYNYLLLSRDPLWSQFTAQNQTLSPPPDYYVWGFALFWPVAILGAIVAFRTKSSPLGAAVFGVVSAFALAYAPVEIQRRFLQNITIPLAILAIAGLIKIFETNAPRYSGLVRWRASLIMLFMFLTSISSIQLALGQGAYLQTHPKNLYYPVTLDDAINWFRNNAQYNDVVLASEQTSQILAQKAGLRAYFGHEMETLGYKTKRVEVQDFFEGKLHQLASSPVKWVVYGLLEKELNPNFQPTDNLELVYDNQDLQIYRVK
jgi:hypothetical protein